MKRKKEAKKETFKLLFIIRRTAGATAAWRKAITTKEISNGLGHTTGEAKTAGFDWSPYLRTDDCTDDCTPDNPEYLGYIPGDTLNYPWLDAAIAQVDFRWG